MTLQRPPSAVSFASDTVENEGKRSHMRRKDTPYNLITVSVYQVSSCCFVILSIISLLLSAIAGQCKTTNPIVKILPTHQPYKLSW